VIALAWYSFLLLSLYLQIIYLSCMYRFRSGQMIGRCVL
jgi:hypothetical protein